MAEGKLNRVWLLLSIILVVIALSAIGFAWSRYRAPEPVKITIVSAATFSGDIYVTGAVAAPGLYPLESDDTVNALLQAAGGPLSSASLSEMKLYVPRTTPEAQRVDINRAEEWLLDAVPGIGETLANRIVDYREKNGPFRQTADLLKVEGIGTKLYQQIEDKIAVSD